MKIYRFYSEGFKKLKVVDITPKEHVQVISGANEAGKSSILEAIYTTLSYRDIKKQIPSPINKQYDKALVELDLGDYIVTRTFSNGGETTNLKITRPNGDEVKSPQRLLDGLLGDLSFDPLKFSREEFINQKERIARAIKIDLNALDRKHADAYDRRKELNKEKEQIDNKLSLIRPPTRDESRVERSIDELSQKLEKSSKRQSLLQNKSSYLDEIQQLEAKIVAIRNKISNIDLLLQETELLESPEEIKSQINMLHSHNTRVKEILDFEKLEKKKEEIDKEIAKSKATMELAKIERAEAIENAKLPIPNFDIREDGIYVNKVPWQQLSQAQKIKYSIAIAVASSPKLRVLLISDGSLLDQSSLKIVEEIAKQNDYQIWIEMVDETNTRGIFLEAGEVRGNHD